MNKDLKPGLIILFFGVMGLILAAVEQFLVDNGYVIDEYIAESVTLPDLQIITIILALLIGCVCAAVSVR